MRKAVLTTAGALFAAGATGVLGIAMLAAPTAAWASSGGCSQSSPCTLAFTADGQPAGTTVNTTITSSFDSPTAGPVKVEVLDSLGQLVTNSKAAITIAITSTANPGGGKLSGTKTVSASGGVASFSGLSIDQPGIGYRLTATSHGLGSVTSGHFTIWSSLQPCSSTTSCSATTSSATTSGTVTTTSSAGSTQFLGTGIGGGTYSCATYQPVSDPFTFDVINGTGDTLAGQFTAVLRIDKSLVLSSGHPGASTWQICYASMSPFTAQPDTSGTATIGDVTFFTGLLPDCSNTTPVAPCVQARNKDNAGDVLVTFLASGDPIGRG
jgi:hypothetical protein